MKIVVAYPTRSSFVARDINILRTRHQIEEIKFHSSSPRYLSDGIRKIADADLLLLWFVSPRSIPFVIQAVNRRKPIVAIVGGYEAANCPEIDYGSARKPHLRAITRWLLNRSAAIVAVSRASRDSIVQNLKIPSARISVVYHGFEDIASSPAIKKHPVVLTVGDITQSNWLRKGQLDFMQAAAQMPDTQFVHIGASLDDPELLLGARIPANVLLAGHKPFESLFEDYGSAKVYLQMSRHESFGCSVAEAMLFRCIPVVRNLYALPEVVGDAGVIVDDDSTLSMVGAIRSALATDECAGERARQFVLREFSWEKRASALLNLVDSLAS